MDDAELLGRINQLAQEEHRLFEQRSHTRVAADRARLREIELMLDQCWDLLRQRRARRAAGLDPDEARARLADGRGIFGQLDEPRLALILEPQVEQLREQARAMLALVVPAGVEQRGRAAREDRA